MKVRPHYSWHQTRLGPRAGSFAAECGGAAETAACLACVWVTELVRDGGREGTSGPQLVCQSQPSTCCYHFWQTGPGPGTNNLSLTEIMKVDCTYAHILWHVSDSLSIWTKHVTWLVCLFPTSTGLLTCLSRFVTRNKTSSPFPRRQSSDELSIVLITTWALILCVRMSPCVRLSLDIPLSFHAFSVCVVLSSSVEPAVCICCTWLTCSRRAGCQQKPHHFTSPLSASHPCQEDCLSALKTHRVHSWDICDWSLCVLCTWAAICSISAKLCLTSRVYRTYLPPSPGIPAPGEQAASSTMVALNQLWQTKTALESEANSVR